MRGSVWTMASMLAGIVGCGDKGEESGTPPETSDTDTDTDSDADTDTDTDADTDASWFSFKGGRYVDLAGYCHKVTGTDWYQLALVGDSDVTGTGGSFYLTFQGSMPPEPGEYTIVAAFSGGAEVILSLTDHADSSIWTSQAGGTISLLDLGGGELGGGWTDAALLRFGGTEVEVTSGYKRCVPE